MEEKSLETLPDKVTVSGGRQEVEISIF